MDNTKCDYCGKEGGDCNLCDDCMMALDEIFKRNLAGYFRDAYMATDEKNINPVIWLAERREQI